MGVILEEVIPANLLSSLLDGTPTQEDLHNAGDKIRKGHGTPEPDLFLLAVCKKGKHDPFQVLNMSLKLWNFQDTAQDFSDKLLEAAASLFASTYIRPCGMMKTLFLDIPLQPERIDLYGEFLNRTDAFHQALDQHSQSYFSEEKDQDYPCYIRIAETESETTDDEE